MASKNILQRSRLNKAQALFQSNQLGEAEGLLLQITQAAPREVEAWLLLGVINGRQGQHVRAAEFFRLASELRPDDARIQYNLGIALRDSGKLQPAITRFRKTLQLQPDHPMAGACLADACMHAGLLDESEAAYRAALRRQPGNAELHANLGALLQTRGRVEEAAACYRQALHINPDLPAYDSYGSALAEQGDFAQAMAIYREGLRRAPKNARIYSNLLMDMNYMTGLTRQQVYEEHCDWDRVHGNPPGRIMQHANSREPDRRLRIGYVSPDFRMHSVAYYIEPLLAGHHRDSVEVWCYSVMPSPDDTTRHLRSLADHWHDIYGWSDRQLVQQVVADGIDILVDLAGHTAHNSLTAFAFKPAPVQVTYLGYPNTTGLSAIDYRLTDGIADPEGQERYYSEQLVRLPGCFLCFMPLQDAPSLSPLPASNTGHITFGSFNNLSKVSPDVVGLWSRVVQSVPGSRLMVKTSSLSDESVCARYREQFRAQGLEDAQLELVGHTPSRKEHLAMYSHVDIALDTFPYNGTTTTCEALWMGVPVITLKGEVHAARVGATLLNSAGLRELVAESQDDFVQLATGLAHDTARLEQQRAGLRRQLSASPLCDRESFVRDVEQAYREMWVKWCEQGAA